MSRHHPHRKFSFCKLCPVILDLYGVLTTDLPLLIHSLLGQYMRHYSNFPPLSLQPYLQPFGIYPTSSYTY